MTVLNIYCVRFIDIFWKLFNNNIMRINLHGRQKRWKVNREEMGEWKIYEGRQRCVWQWHWQYRHYLEIQHGRICRRRRRGKNVSMCIPRSATASRMRKLVPDRRRADGMYPRLHCRKRMHTEYSLVFRYGRGRFWNRAGWWRNHRSERFCWQSRGWRETGRCSFRQYTIGYGRYDSSRRNSDTGCEVPDLLLVLVWSGREPAGWKIRA